MDDLKKQLRTLEAEVAAAVTKLKIAELEARQQELELQSQSPDFWSNSDQAQAVQKEIAKLQRRTAPWLTLQTKLGELDELLQLSDQTLEAELAKDISICSESFKALKDELKFSGPYDDHDAILTISAGAGGTDAQDWAQMLLRMYTRWAEANGYDARLVEESAGEEAGIKSATLEISGSYGYGKLQGEHGVHRLVRLSPFNADNLRQTSFAKVEVMPKLDQPDELVIDDKDLKVDVYRSGGHGGQSVNTTDSAVRITHLPTGISVAIQNERSQLQNKETALGILRGRLAQLQLEQHTEKLADLKGPNEQAAWGNQIRSYVLHPYKQVKDLRTKYETSDPDAVLAGNLTELINAYLEYSLASS